MTKQRDDIVTRINFIILERMNADQITLELKYRMEKILSVL